MSSTTTWVGTLPCVYGLGFSSLRSPVPVPVAGLGGSSGLKMMSVPESTSGMLSPLKSATFMMPEESVFLRVSEPPSGVFLVSGVRPPKSSLIQVVIVPSSLVKMTSRSPSSSTSTVSSSIGSQVTPSMSLRLTSGRPTESS